LPAAAVAAVNAAAWPEKLAGHPRPEEPSLQLALPQYFNKGCRIPDDLQHRQVEAPSRQQTWLLQASPGVGNGEWLVRPRLGPLTSTTAQITSVTGASMLAGCLSNHNFRLHSAGYNDRVYFKH